MFKKLVPLAILITFVSCSSTSKEINSEASNVEPKTREEIIISVQDALENSTKITKDEKMQFLKVARKNFQQREKLRYETDQLLTLLIEKAHDKNYSIYKLQKIAKKIKKNEHKIVDLKMNMLKELRIFAKDRIDAAQKKNISRHLLKIEEDLNRPM